MKKIILASLIISLFSFSKCKKDKPDSNGLPSATQTGANTLGFLLNGQPWTPKGFNGSTTNLSISVDEGYKNGTFNITAYKIINGTNKQYLAFGIADSLNFLSPPVSIEIGKPLFGLLFTNSICTYDGFNDTLIYKRGQLTLSKFDKINRIISGTFMVTFFKNSCGDTLKVTEGRFDLKY